MSISHQEALMNYNLRWSKYASDVLTRIEINGPIPEGTDMHRHVSDQKVEIPVMVLHLLAAMATQATTLTRAIENREEITNEIQFANEHVIRILKALDILPSFNVSIPGQEVAPLTTGDRVLGMAFRFNGRWPT